MLSLTTVSAGQAAHYYSQKDNYYDRSAGQWHGSGAETLGLYGDIEKEAFELLLQGHDPDGKELVSKGANGEHRAGVDLTLSAPKSVSILAEISNADGVNEAHEKAVNSTLYYIEKNFSQTRFTENGITEKVNTDNLVIAKFQHDTSRELDPQLHTHSVVMNMTQRADGEWRALSNEELFTNKMFLGQVYRNELAANLNELGYNIQSDQKGLFEIAGIDQELIEHFSRRSEQIENKVAELKESGLYPNIEKQKLREIATLSSRIAKKDVDMEVVRESWQERLQEQGYSKEQIQDTAFEASTEAYEPEQKFSAHDYMGISLKAITDQESVFTHQKALREAAKLSIGQYRISDLERAFSNMRQEGEIIQLESNAYTTPEIQNIEKDIVDMVSMGRDSIQPALDGDSANAAIDAWEKSKSITLTSDQRRAVLHVFTATDLIVGVQGDAGSGKTAMLSAVRDVLEKQGWQVKGYAFTGKAADEMEKGAGIKSQTLHSALSSDKPDPTEKQVWIVDEASLVGSRQLYSLLQNSEQAEARLVLVGDTKQLQAIEAGRMFQILQENGTIKTANMSAIIRQKDNDYRELVQDLSAKRIDRTFDLLEKQGRITEITDGQERLKAMVSDYVERNDAVIVTARNDDRNELNTAIRQELKEREQLNGDEHTFIVRESKGLSPIDRRFANSYNVGDLLFSRKAGIFGRAGAEARIVNLEHDNHTIVVERTGTRNGQGEQFVIDLKQDGDKVSAYSEKLQSFMESDRIVFLKNDKGLNVQNGVTGEIVSLDENGNISVKTDAGKDISFNVHSQYNYIDHGYAVTDYKAQGRTVDDVLYHADTSKDVSFNQAYVAITRGREDVAIYTDDKENLREQMKSERTKTSTIDFEKEISGDSKSDIQISHEHIIEIDKTSSPESGKEESAKHEAREPEKENSSNVEREVEKDRVIELEV